MALRNAFENLATESKQDDSNSILGTLSIILKLLRIPVGFDLSLNRQRSTAIIESGTVTTVTTCSTVSSLTNIDTYQGKQLVLADIRNAWANTVSRRFYNGA